MFKWIKDDTEVITKKFKKQSKVIRWLWKRNIFSRNKNIKIQSSMAGLKNKLDTKEK